MGRCQHYIEAMDGFDLMEVVLCLLPVKILTNNQSDDGKDYQFFSRHRLEAKYQCLLGMVLEPFPDIKITITKEIISCGGAVSVEDLRDGGEHLTPKEFHTAIAICVEQTDFLIIDHRILCRKVTLFGPPPNAQRERDQSRGLSRLCARSNSMFTFDRVNLTGELRQRLHANVPVAGEAATGSNGLSPAAGGHQIQQRVHVSHANFASCSYEGAKYESRRVCCA